MKFFSSFNKKGAGSELPAEDENGDGEVVVSTETIKGKALRDINFFNRSRMEEKTSQYRTQPHTPPNTPTDAIPHPSYTLLDEHPGHLYHERPMTGKKTLKPPGGHKQQGLRFADDTNISRKPEVPTLPIRPITYDGRASGRETFYASTEKKPLTASEEEAKKTAKAKKEGAYVKPTTRAAKASGTQKENEPIGAQSQSPVQMPRRPSSSDFNAEGSVESRMPQFGDFNNIRGVVRETLFSDRDHEIESMQDVHASQQPFTSNEAGHGSQRRYSGGNKGPQGSKLAVVIGDMGPPPVPHHAARRNAATSKQESNSRLSSWLGTNQDKASQKTGGVGQEMRDSQYASRLGQGTGNSQKRPLDCSEDDVTMQEAIQLPVVSTSSSISAVNEAGGMSLKQHPPAQSGFSFTPHLLPGARGAARRFPPPQPEAGPCDYSQFFNPEQALHEPQDPEIRAIAASIVDNTNKTPPCEHRRTTAIPMLRKFKEKFLNTGMPDGTVSPRTHAEIIARNANSQMFASRLDSLLTLCDAIECLLCCVLPHNKRRYPAPPFCNARKNPVIFPPSPDEMKLFVADNLYDESVQLLSDTLRFILRFESLGLSENPLLNNDAKQWLFGLEKLEQALNRMGVLVAVIGNRCMCGQWDYVASMGEVLNAVGGIWTIATGTLRPPNWEGRIPHLSVGIDPANIPPNSVIVALQSPQVTRYPQQPTAPGNAPHNYQQQVNAADQYWTTPSPAHQAPVATSSGYGQHAGTAYQTASNFGAAQYPGTTYQTARSSGYGHGQQPSSTYQTAGNSGYSQFPSTTHHIINNSGTSQYQGATYQSIRNSGYGQQPSSTYQSGGSSGYGPYPGPSYQSNQNGQWAPDLAYNQRSTSTNTFSYPQQTSALGQQTNTANTGGPAWYEVLPDGTQPNPYSMLNQSLD
ncbi:hypothetical protein EV426DRAFT_577883 [Tirmania nivea]|nr:hypothetical protein EV426DRAFT_577883 [Tirmania nivea]